MRSTSATRTTRRAADSRTRLKPLAMMLGEALEAPTTEARFRGLQRLGDVSLFIAGFFSAGFARKLVDIDYHIAMGGQAYGTLAESCPPARARTLRQVFAELAAKFQPMVDALNEISESSYQHSDQDRLRLYELWVKTGSERSRQLLRKLGARARARRAQRAGALNMSQRHSRVRCRVRWPRSTICRRRRTCAIS